MIVKNHNCTSSSEQPQGETRNSNIQQRLPSTESATSWKQLAPAQVLKTHRLPHTEIIPGRKCETAVKAATPDGIPFDAK